MRLSMSTDNRSLWSERGQKNIDGFSSKFPASFPDSLFTTAHFPSFCMRCKASWGEGSLILRFSPPPTWVSCEATLISQVMKSSTVNWVQGDSLIRHTSRQMYLFSVHLDPNNGANGPHANVDCWSLTSVDHGTYGSEKMKMKASWREGAVGELVRCAYRLSRPLGIW